MAASLPQTVLKTVARSITGDIKGAEKHRFSVLTRRKEDLKRVGIQTKVSFLCKVDVAFRERWRQGGRRQTYKEVGTASLGRPYRLGTLTRWIQHLTQWVSLVKTLGIVTILAYAAVRPAVTRAVATEQAVAMVTDLQGRAFVIEAGRQERPCEILTSLVPGMELRIEERATLTVVYFQSAKEYQYTGPSHIGIGIDRPANISGKRATSRDLMLVAQTGLDPSDLRDYRQAAILFRQGAWKEKLHLLSPEKNSKIIEVHPTFHWKALEEPGVQYRLVLIDNLGHTVLETLTDGSSFRLPVKVKLQEGGSYIWQVEARLPSGMVYSNSAKFRVAERSVRDELERLRPAKHASFSERILFAMLLDREDIRDEARDYWKRLAAERPDNPQLRWAAEAK
jgi:hypothetical protein